MTLTMHFILFTLPLIYQNDNIIWTDMKIIPRKQTPKAYAPIKNKVLININDKGSYEN